MADFESRRRAIRAAAEKVRTGPLPYRRAENATLIRRVLPSDEAVRRIALTVDARRRGSDT